MLSQIPFELSKMKKELLNKEICRIGMIAELDAVNLYEQLGEKRSHFSYYEYSALPLIHMCQFDDCIHLGLQLYHKEDVAGSLLDYCIEINSGSILGLKILEQFDYLKDKKSTDIFKSRKYQEWKKDGVI